jgi:aminoglycoside phosphotransferase
MPTPSTPSSSSLNPSGNLTEEDLNVDYPRPGSKFKKNVGIIVPELLHAAAHALEKPISPLPSIRTFAHGGFAKIFLITFADATELIVRAPFPRDYSAPRMRSEVATMLFAREHLGLPAPRLFAWALTPQNAAGAPYLIMERLPGVQISEKMWFTELARRDKKRVLERVAELHARLVKPLPFEEVGNLYLSDIEQVQPRVDHNVPTERFYVGPAIRSQKYTDEREDVSAPTKAFRNVLDYWKELADLEFQAGRARWARQADPYIVPEEDAGAALNYRPQTTADFADTFRNLSAILGAYRTPPESSSLCLWHNDFAFRNILIDSTTLAITGMLDWEDVSVVPVVLASRCPDELEQTNKDFRGWSFFPDEWLAFQPREDDPHHGEECIDATWDRWYYSSRVALHDSRFSARLWRGSERSLKLQELLARGWFFWLERQEWLAEAAGRLAPSDARCEAPSS